MRLLSRMMMKELFWHGITNQIVRFYLLFMKPTIVALMSCPMVSIFTLDVSRSLYFSFLCSLDDEFTSIIDVAGLKENVNYTKKEQTIASRAKESIQGSIEMAKATYVLQWMNTPTSESSCRLMYFYEILSSANYRGSMTSLQSQSAISLHSIRWSHDDVEGCFSKNSWEF